MRRHAWRGLPLRGPRRPSSSGTHRGGLRAGGGGPRSASPARPTPFQRRVFAVVKRIPKGEVRSYQWVARQLGDAKLARAVGQALHRNPWPIRVPCHRVVRADGSLGGYAWGVAKKRRLLKQEGVRALA